MMGWLAEKESDEKIEYYTPYDIQDRTQSTDVKKDDLNAMKSVGKAVQVIAIKTEEGKEAVRILKTQRVDTTHETYASSNMELESAVKKVAEMFLYYLHNEEFTHFRNHFQLKSNTAVFRSADSYDDICNYKYRIMPAVTTTAINKRIKSLSQGSKLYKAKCEQYAALHEAEKNLIRNKINAIE